ncbi:uncharacterized protein LOC131947508 isoform X2 [Physella acuta]|nr:uncharacterized protein LOC131947508 isoform X2 [Physella acuta]
MYRKEKPEAVEPAEGQLLCKVCGDIANGVHFGVTTCEGCKKFFRRGLKENKTYTCKASNHCSINPRMRNNCRYCRYQKCLHEGMSREAIKMGRPKKGELLYRKPAKKNGMKQQMKPYDKPMLDSNRSSMSSEYDQDDVSSSGEVFDVVASQHIHQQQHQMHQQQQQQPVLTQQQQGSFSLGSILHDCMTVQDWDQKVHISELEQDALREPAHTMVSEGAGVSEESQQVSPHIRHASPTMHHEMVAHLQRHPKPLRMVVTQQQLEQLHRDMHQGHHQLAPYHDHNQNHENLQVLRNIEYSSDHNVTDSRIIKVENMSLQEPPGASYPEGVVIEDMQNLQAINKVEYHSYQLQGADGGSGYTLEDQRTASIPSGPSSQMDPLVAINMSSQNAIYTPQGQELIIIHNLNQQSELPGNQPGNQVHGRMVQEMEHLPPSHDAGQSQHIMDLDESHQVIGSQELIRNNHHGAPHSYHNLMTSRTTTYTDINTGIQSHHYLIDNNVESPGNISTHINDGSPRVSDSNFSMIPKGQPSDPTSPSLSVSSQQNLNPHHKFQRVRSPIAAILQQHREDIQAGRPVHLSSEEIEELLNTVNSDQARAQRFNSEQAAARAMDQDVVDLRRQPMNNFILNDDQQLDEPVHYNRQSSPGAVHYNRQSSPGAVHYNRQPSPSAVRHFLNKSPYQNQYIPGSPINQNIIRAPSRQYQSQTSPGSDSSTDRQDVHRGFNNNNNTQVCHYISVPQDPQDCQVAPDADTYDDSFNSSLIRDCTLLHEINRIFLGIDNSCETYGCNCARDGQDTRDDGAIVSSISPDEFSPEISHKYWHSFQPNTYVPMTAERSKIIEDVLDAFDNLQKTYVTNEPEYVNKKMPHDQLEHWHHIQRRIARHVVAGQRFCRNIPGYFKLDIQDRISLGKHVGFGLMVLIACTEFYDPEFKRFKYIWNWTMPMQNPLFSYKVHLLSLGNRIHEIQVDKTEASMMCAISMTSIDCPGLIKPGIVCLVRNVLIDALEAHIAAKPDSSDRLQKLLSLMPQVRLMTVWYNNLMKKMSLPSEFIKSNKTSEGTENSANFS